MALSNTNISVPMVRDELGAATNDVGQLCIHPNINKWSKWKPVRSNKIEPLTVTDIENLKSGLNRVDMYEVEYEKPRGTLSEPYRLSDFSNYNKVAIPPVNVEIVSVTEMLTGDSTTAPPFIMFFNFTYEIAFKFPIGGEIDPLLIHPQTSRTKNTNAGGGYGGLSWVSGTDNTVTRVSADVFTAPSGSTIHKQRLMILPNGILNPLRVQYCQYNGFETGDYTTVPYAIENSDYLELLTFNYLNIEMALDTWYNGLEGKAESRLTVTNNSGKVFGEVRARFVYTINGGTAITAIGYIAPLAIGVNNLNQPLNNGSPGANTYSVYCYLEIYNNLESTWVQLAWTNRTQTVTFPMG